MFCFDCLDFFKYCSCLSYLVSDVIYSFLNIINGAKDNDTQKPESESFLSPFTLWFKEISQNYNFSLQYKLSVEWLWKWVKVN